LNLTLEQLRKILELERAKGYQDRAVLGGLDRLLERLGKENGALASLLEPGYAALDIPGRARWVSAVLQQLEAAQPPSPTPPPRPRLEQAPGLDAPVTSMRGINRSLGSKFGRLGVRTVHDLLYFFPHRHIDYTRCRSIAELEVGSEQTVVAIVWQAGEKWLGGRRGTEAILGDETGNMRAVWFNQPYLAKRLLPNQRLVLSGRVAVFRGHKVFQSPEYELIESDDPVHTGRLVPVYPLTARLTPRVVRKLVKNAVDTWAPHLPEFLPEVMIQRLGLLPLSQAIRQAHYPDSLAEKDSARRRLAFQELFLIQLGVLAKRRDRQEGEQGLALSADSTYLEPFLASLPFALTRAQERVLAEIEHDLRQPKPMSRLLQGEVGSGKTVVATAAMLLAAASGHQAALMAPTEILAEQHFENICQLLAKAGGQEGEGLCRTFPWLLPSPLRVGLLIGALKESAKQEVQQQIAAGEIDIAIGTHALIQKGVDFPNLGLAVVDEQHRFGVMQRSALRHKGTSPHALVMSATPIPRTLALTLYGDLDLSVIDELPPGRMEIKTRWLSPTKRASAYDFVRKQVEAGRQAFIICPLIEESEAIDTKAATVEYQRLQQVFPDLRLGLLHGRMASAEKEEAMRRFRGGRLDILVSTPVVEVGIDVPNATVMLVEGADRFGLAQLHQFRGRVGRGEEQSYCLLLAENPSNEARQRLSLLERTQDGFDLAEEDLRLRGPGAFFGTRQSGLPDLKMARLSDTALLELAREEALKLFAADPWLEREEHHTLAEEVARLWEEGSELS